MASFSFELKPAAPFRLDLTVWALRRRPENLIDRWDGETYSRILLIQGAPLEIRVHSTGSVDSPVLHVLVQGSRLSRRSEPEVRRTVITLLGAQLDLSPFYFLADRDRRLKRIVDQFRGMKPPCFPTVFEALINAVACQQLTLTVGIQLLNRLSALCGKEGTSGMHAFPAPDKVLQISLDQMRALGFSFAKARAISEVACAANAGELEFGRLSQLSDEELRERLMALKGIGRWSAEYAMLRGLGRLSIFPSDDAGARNKLEALFGSGARMSYSEVGRRVARWRPFAGLVYFHLLLSGLTERGLIRT